MIDPHGEPVREKYRKQGEERERERILALLEETRDCKSQWDYEVRIGEIIAKIKGENK
jgi:hypothetical protein